MKTNNAYVDLDGNPIALAELDSEERKLVAGLRRRARTHPDWIEFGNYWMAVVADFYDARGLTRKQSRRTAAYRIGQDLSSRLGITQGYIRPKDYRSELETLIRDHFPSRRAFCQATGLSEDMLSHVLAGRKDPSLGALTDALARIGYTLRILPAPERKRTG
jgi:transcriptional regulator with XRE-family HTH domain